MIRGVIVRLPLRGWHRWRWLGLTGILLLILILYGPGLIYTNLLGREILYFEEGYREPAVSWDIVSLLQSPAAASRPAAAGWTQARWLFVHARPDAVWAYRAALERDPANPLIAFELGNLYEAAGDVERALIYWQRAGSGRFWAYQAILASEADNPFLTMEYIDRAQAVATADPIVQLETADLLFKLGRMERALPAYSNFIALASAGAEPRLAHALTQRARANFAVRGDWRLSERDLLSALALSPNDVWIQIRLCELYRNVDYLDDALVFCQAAVATAPRSASAHYYLGRVLFARRDFDAASVQFQIALDLDPHFDGARYWLEHALGQY